MADGAVRQGEVFVEPGAERREAGRRLLALIDGVSFGATGAFWAYRSEEKLWQLVLVTPMIDDRGPLWVYERLLQAFKRWALPAGITPLEIVLRSPREALFRAFPYRSTKSPSGEATGTEDLGASILGGGEMFGSLVIYRMEPFAEGADTSDQFDHDVQALLAA